jgi:serine/threonine-protein kinase RsbW
MRFVDSPPEPFGRPLLELRIPGVLGYKTPLTVRALKALRAEGALPPWGHQMAELMLEELIANGLIHGNGLDESKELELRVFSDGQRFGVFVRDEGEGFSPEDVPDPEDPENLMLEHGRGLLLVSHYVDELVYHRPSRTIAAIRRFQTEPDPGARPPEAEPEPAFADPSEVDLESLPPAPAPTARRAESEVAIPDELELADLSLGEPAGEGEPVVERLEGEIKIVSLRESRLTEDNAAPVKQALSAAMGEGRKLVLDLSALEFSSSVGISVIMAGYKQAMQRQAAVVIAGVQPAMDNIFRITGLTRFFKTAETVEEAKAKLEG